MYRIRVVAVVAMVALACRSTLRDDVRALAARGLSTGTRLSDYYESLARDTVEAWELTAFRRGFLKLPAPETSLRPAFEAQYKALRARARLARRVSNVYEALGRVSAYDGGGEIIGAVKSLETELQGVVESPLRGPVRRDLLEKAIKAVASWKQNRVLRADASALAPLAEALEELFRSERELYSDISDDRAERYRQIAIELVKAREVVSSALVTRVLSSYDLAWPDVKQPFTDERTISGILELIDARSKTFAAKSQDETESIGEALKALVEAQKL